jgi:hypothetical protein
MMNLTENKSSPFLRNIKKHTKKALFLFFFFKWWWIEVRKRSLP